MVSGVVTNYTAPSWLERSFSLSFAISFACFVVSRDCSGVISSLFNVSSQAVVSRRALVQSAVFPLWSHQLHGLERSEEEWKTLLFFPRKFALPPSLTLNESNRMCSGKLFSYSQQVIYWFHKLPLLLSTWSTTFLLWFSVPERQISQRVVSNLRMLLMEDSSWHRYYTFPVLFNWIDISTTLFSIMSISGTSSRRSYRDRRVQAALHALFLHSEWWDYSVFENE